MKRLFEERSMPDGGRRPCALNNVLPVMQTSRAEEFADALETDSGAIRSELSP